MDEKAEALILELAEKFGTTAEHLWAVLVRQAPITGVIDLMVMAAWALAVLWAFRLIRAKTSKSPEAEGSYHQTAEWEDGAAFAAWLIWGFAASIVALVGGASLSGTVGAIVNPEYWALKQLLP